MSAQLPPYIGLVGKTAGGHWLGKAGLAGCGSKDASASEQGALIGPLLLPLAQILMEKSGLGVRVCRYFPAHVQRSLTQGLVVFFFKKKPF